MIEGRDIVCQSFVTWDDHWGTPQQQMSRFAARNRVFFIDQPISPLSLLTGVRSHSAVLRQFRRWRQGPRQVAANVWAGAPPPILPLRNLRLLNRLNAAIMRRWLRGQVTRLGFRDVIYWNFQPQSPGLARAVRPALSIFHCVDDFSAIPQWWNMTDSSIAREAESCREADVVICTGRKLVESRRKYNRNIHFVPEGADVELFFGAASPDTVVPQPIAALPGKVIGYIGVIDFRLDTALLACIAKQRPHWSIAIVGPVKSGTADMSELQALSNVYFFPRQPLEALPAYLKKMDVCLIPYVLNDYTHHIFPLKLYEYMAAGKPIVASDMEEMRPYAGAEMAIAHGPEGFLAEIDSAIADDSPERARARQEAARNESWDHRVEQVSAIIGPMLRERDGRGRGSVVPAQTALEAGSE